MISRGEMMTPILAACPSFRPLWHDFLNEWKDDKNPPEYLAIADLVRHVIELYTKGDVASVQKVFDVVERWHIEGDAYVKEAATIGFIEDIQNTNLHSTTSPTDFEKFLGVESRKWWLRVHEFWEKGTPIAGD